MLTFYKPNGIYYPSKDNNIPNTTNKNLNNPLANPCCFCKFSGKLDENFSVSKETCSIYKILNDFDADKKIKIIFPKKDCIFTHDINEVKKFVNKYVDISIESGYNEYIDKENLEKEREYFNNLTDLTQVKDGGFFNPCNFCDHVSYVEDKIQSERYKKRHKDINPTIKTITAQDRKDFYITPKNCPFFKADIIEEIQLLNEMDCYYEMDLYYVRQDNKDFPYNEMKEILVSINNSKSYYHYNTCLHHSNIKEIEDILLF